MKLSSGVDHRLKLWDVLHARDQEGCIIVCSSRKDEQGIISGHAYSVLQLEQVDAEIDDETGEALRLVQVRNPHGCNEYEGRFSDNDSAWEDYPQAAMQCGRKNDDDHDTEDGTFWMPFLTFLQLFQMLSVNLQTNKDTLGRPQPRFDPGNSSVDSVDVLSLDVEGHEWESYF